MKNYQTPKSYALNITNMTHGSEIRNSFLNITMPWPRSSLSNILECHMGHALSLLKSDRSLIEHSHASMHISLSTINTFSYFIIRIQTYCTIKA